MLQNGLPAYHVSHITSCPHQIITSFQREKRAVFGRSVTGLLKASRRVFRQFQLQRSIDFFNFKLIKKITQQRTVFFVFITVIIVNFTGGIKIIVFSRNQMQLYTAYEQILHS